MEELVEEVRNRKGKAIPLAVSGAFHTPLMAEASAEFAKELDRQDWHDARFPVYCNVNGEALIEGEKIHAAVRRQMTSSVFWVDTVGNQWNARGATLGGIRPQGRAHPHGASHPHRLQRA